LRSKKLRYDETVRTFCGGGGSGDDDDDDDDDDCDCGSSLAGNEFCTMFYEKWFHHV
jgi:hypothetical protein